MLVVAAAGNDGAGIVDFPADLDNVIGGGRARRAQAEGPLLEHGPELDLVAPGGDCDRDDDGDGNADCVFQQTPDPELVAGRPLRRVLLLRPRRARAWRRRTSSAAAALLFSQGFTDAALGARGPRADRGAPGRRPAAAATTASATA